MAKNSGANDLGIAKNTQEKEGQNDKPVPREGVCSALKHNCRGLVQLHHPEKRRSQYMIEINQERYGEPHVKRKKEGLLNRYLETTGTKSPS